MRRWYAIGIVTIAAWAAASGFARAGSGFYLSSEMGANFTPNADINGTGYDGPSDCDEYINPLAPQDPKCAAQGITQWMSNADGASGILAGVAVGYRLRGRDHGGLWDHFRLELEYFYRESEYNQTSPVSATGGAAFAKADGELQRAEDWIGSLTSHNLFGNLYFDFINDSLLPPTSGLGPGPASRTSITEASGRGPTTRIASQPAATDPTRKSSGRTLPARPAASGRNSATRCSATRSCSGWTTR